MFLEELNQKLKQQNLIGYWTIPNTSTGFREPEASYRPFLWKWNEICAALDGAARFIRPEEAFRRFIGYQHPELDWCRQNYEILRPHSTSTPASNLYRPPYRYSWQDTERALASMIEAPGDPYDGILLRYSDPVSGGSTLPTMNCEVQMFRPGEQGRSHRHTYTVVYHVFRGSGTTLIGDQKFAWEQGDSFVVPLWNWHVHENQSKERAILFRSTTGRRSNPGIFTGREPGIEV